MKTPNVDDNDNNNDDDGDDEKDHDQRFCVDYFEY